MDDFLNVRDVEALVMGRKPAESKPVERMAAPQKDADTRAAEKEMSDAVGLAVVINPGRGEAGEIIIRYKTMDQFDVIHRALLAHRKV